jgi:hypothetical protein
VLGVWFITPVIHRGLNDSSTAYRASSVIRVSRIMVTLISPG